MPQATQNAYVKTILGQHPKKLPDDFVETLIEEKRKQFLLKAFTGVSKFKMMIKALQNRLYSEAAIQMLDSRWAKQTPNRAKELSEHMAKA